MPSPFRALNLSIAVAIALWPLASPALDLMQAFEAAREYDAPVASARLQLLSVQERLPQAQAGLKPALSGIAAANTTRVDTNITAPRSFNNVNGGLNLSVPLYRPGNGVLVDQAQIAISLAQMQLAQAEQDLLTRLAQAYFDVLAAQDATEVAQAQRRAIAEQFEAAKRNFEVGTATITDQQEAQARLDLNDALLAAARNDLIVRRATLRTLTGVDVESLNTLKRETALPEPEEAIEQWTAAARKQNYGVLQAELSADIARKEVERARYARSPAIDLVSQANLLKGRTASGSPLVDRTASLSAGVQLTVPLYTGGALDARERETLALVRRSEIDLENARRNAEQGSRQIYLGLRSSLEQARALEAAERSSRLALESNLLGYQVGVRINVDVLNAQQQLFSTRRDLSRARYDVLINTLRLKASSGQLAAEDVSRINALLSAPQAQTFPSLPSPAPVAPRDFGGAVTKPVLPGSGRQPPARR